MYVCMYVCMYKLKLLDENKIKKIIKASYDNATL